MRPTTTTTTTVTVFGFDEPAAAAFAQRCIRRGDGVPGAARGGSVALAAGWHPDGVDGHDDLSDLENLIAEAGECGAITSPDGWRVTIETDAGGPWCLWRVETPSDQFSIASPSWTQPRYIIASDTAPGVPAIVAVIRETVEEANRLIAGAYGCETGPVLAIPCPPGVPPAVFLNLLRAAAADAVEFRGQWRDQWCGNCVSDPATGGVTKPCADHELDVAAAAGFLPVRDHLNALLGDGDRP